MPTTPDALIARLAGLGISVAVHHHPPVFTVEESKRLRGALPGGHCKNLFLKDRKDRLWLVVALEDRAVDLKALRLTIGSAPLSFASPALLRSILGIEPGAVTPFAVVNDTEGRVTVVLDQEMMGLERLNYHPLTNARTAAIRPDDLLAFLRSTGHEPRILAL